MADVHRGRHQLRPPGRADGPLLHLLFDVRLPAHRRPHLAGRRRPGQGLPHGRHRRTHDAARRGPAAPGRPQPRAGVDRAALPGLRPGLRLRDGHDRASTASGGCTARRRRTSSTTSPSTTRTTRCRPCPSVPGVEEGIVQGLYKWADGARGPVEAGHRAVLRLGPGRRPRRPRPSWPSTTTSASSCGRPRPTRRCARRRSTSSAGTACTPASAPKVPLVTRLLAGSARARRGRHRLHEDRARPGEPLRAPTGRSSRSAPTASAAPTPGRRCAGCSRSTPPTSWSRCSPAWPSRATPSPRRWPTPSPATASTPTAPAPRCPKPVGHARHALHHGRPRGRRAAQHRSARAAHRHAARPAGADGVGLPRAGHAEGAPRRPRRRRDRGDDRDEVVAVFVAKPALHRYPATMARRTHELCRHLVDHYDGDAADVWRGAATGAGAVRPAARPARLRPGEGPDLRRHPRQADGRGPARLAGGRRRRSPTTSPAPSPTSTRRPRWRRSASGRRR